MSSSHFSFATLGASRWLYHKHHGDPYTIESQSTKHSNYKSLTDSQKLFFDHIPTRPGTGSGDYGGYGYRPTSAKNEIIIRKKNQRPQTAAKRIMPKRKSMQMPDDSVDLNQLKYSKQDLMSSSGQFKKTKKKGFLQQEQNKVVKEFIPLDNIKYTLTDEREKKDKIQVEVDCQDLSKRHQSQELNPVFKFTFDYDLVFQNDSSLQDKICFQLDQQEIFSIFKNMKAQLPKNATYSQCNCKDEYQIALNKAYQEIDNKNDDILQLKNQNELLQNEVEQLKMDNNSYIEQSNQRKELRISDLNNQSMIEQKNMEIKQLQRENKTLYETMNKWHEEQKAKQEEKPTYNSENEEINALNEYIEKLLLKLKETQLELEYLKVHYSEKSQPECINTYEELEEMSDRLMMIMREQDNIDQLIGQYQTKQDTKLLEVNQKVGDTNQMKLIINNQLEQMQRKCRNKLEELKKGPQSNEELIAILECNIEINERIKEVGYLLKKKKNDQKVAIEKRQFSKFEVKEDSNVITMLPDQKVTGTSCQTEEEPKINIGTQTFKEPDEDEKTVEAEVKEFFQYFRFLKTLCAKAGSLEAQKAVDYFSVIAEKMDKIKQMAQMKELKLDSTKYRADKLDRDLQEIKKDNEYMKTHHKKLFSDLNDQMLAKDSKLIDVNQDYKKLKKDFMYKLDAEKKKIEKDLLHQITTLRNDNDDKAHRIAKLTVESQRKINELEGGQKKLEEEVYNLKQTIEEKQFELELKNKESQELEKTYLDKIVSIENAMLKQKYNYNKKVIALEEDLQGNITKGSKLNDVKKKMEISYVENCLNCKFQTPLDKKENGKQNLKQDTIKQYIKYT